MIVVTGSLGLAALGGARRFACLRYCKYQSIFPRKMGKAFTRRSRLYKHRVVARTGQSFSALVSENSTRAPRVGLSGAR